MRITLNIRFSRKGQVNKGCARSALFLPKELGRNSSESCFGFEPIYTDNLTTTVHLKKIEEQRLHHHVLPIPTFASVRRQGGI